MFFHMEILMFYLKKHEELRIASVNVYLVSPGPGVYNL